MCARYGVTSRTIDRWLETGVLPQPMRINKVRYWDEAALDAADLARMAQESDQKGRT
jgi:DNA-binding transcriptional MerR regulator